jgi:hypothetical protein
MRSELFDQKGWLMASTLPELVGGRELDLLASFVKH